MTQQEDQPDPFFVAALTVARLRDALKRGQMGLDAIATSLIEVLQSGAWRERDVRGKRVVFESFKDFVEAPVDQGLGTTLRRVEVMIEHDARALVMFRRALVSVAPEPSQPDGGYNITEAETPNALKRGTGKAYTLDQLEKEAPEVFQEVADGKLSASAGAIKAGLRKKQDGYSKLLSAWRGADEDERAKFATYMKDQGWL